LRQDEDGRRSQCRRLCWQKRPNGGGCRHECERIPAADQQPQ
jgi:hypothetical protein